MTGTLHHRLPIAVLIGLASGCSTAGEPAAHAAPSAAAPATSPATTPVDARATNVAPAAAAADAAVDAGTVAGAPITSYAAALRSADWLHWPGLPADLRETAFVRDLGLDRAKKQRHGGRLSGHDVVVVDTPGLRYWLRDRGRVVLVEVTGKLGAAPPAELRAQLGRPDREGAGRFLQSGATTTEYVYAARGLALTVAESYDHPPSFSPRLAAIQLFASTDLRTFDLELGGNDRTGPSR
jgi:hypothetical protein